MADSVRETLAATMAQLSEPAPEAAPAEAPLAQAETPEVAAAEPEPAAEAGPGRDEKGRFAPKTDTPPAEEGAQAAAPPAETPNPEPAQAAEPTPQDPETSRPPHALPAALKAEWKELPDKWRKAFADQETHIQRFRAEQEGKSQRLNRFDEIIGPRREQLAIRGIDEFRAIQTLFAAQDLLDRNPVAGLLELARSYGVSPAQVAQALGQPQSSDHFGNAPGPAPGQVPDLAHALRPVLEPLQQQVQTLQQQLQGERQAAAIAAVQEFAAKPENMYFENVREDVSRRLESGAASTLQEAYDQAIWASSEIRPLLLEAQQRAAQQQAAAQAEAARKQAEQAARDKAKAAAQAGVSVTGAPTPGAQAPAAPQGNLRDQLRAAYQEVNGAV